MRSMINFTIFNDIVSTLKIILVIIAIFAVVYICYKIPQLLPVVGIALCLTILAFGVFATIDCVEYFKTNNVTIGQVLQSKFNNKSNADEIEGKDLAWNLTNIGFIYTSESTYTTTIEKPFNETIDLSKNDYVLYINDKPCYVNETGNEYVKSQFNYSFYDKNNNLILNDTLYVNFGFYRAKTVIDIETRGGEAAVNLWKAYQVKNGFKFELKAQEKQAFSVNKYKPTIKCELVKNTSDDVFTINMYIDKSLDYLNNREHQSTDTTSISALRATNDEFYYSGYSGINLNCSYKYDTEKYCFYSENYHRSNYEFLNIGQSVLHHYTTEQRRELNNKISLSDTYSSPYLINVNAPNTSYLQLDLSDFDGINPTGMILNIYIDLVKTN